MADMKDFLAKLNEDKAFADEIAAVQNKEELLAKIKAAGFDVTEADLTGTGELSDDELDAVSGGGHFIRTCETCGSEYLFGIGCRNCSPDLLRPMQRRSRPEPVKKEYPII